MKKETTRSLKVLIETYVFFSIVLFKLESSKVKVRSIHGRKALLLL